MIHIEIETASSGDSFWDLAITFRLQSKLLLYLDRFSAVKLPMLHVLKSHHIDPTVSSSSADNSNGLQPAHPADSSTAEPPSSAHSSQPASPTAAPCASTQQDIPPIHEENSRRGQTSDGHNNSVSIVFRRTPKEFKHLIESLHQLFPSLLLPRFPQMEDKSFDHLPPEEHILSLTEATLEYLIVIEDVVSSEVFLAFVDHSACPVGKFETLRVKRHLSEDEHPLGVLLACDRALQPLVANVKVQDVPAPSSPSTQANGHLRSEQAFLRGLSSALHAFLAEASTLRAKIVKDVAERLQRTKKGGFVQQMTHSKERSFKDYVVLIARAPGKTLDDLLAAPHLGDRVCTTSGSFGTVAYVGPPTVKRSDRQIGVVWDEASTAAVPAPGTNNNNNGNGNSSSSNTLSNSLLCGDGEFDELGRIFFCPPGRGGLCKANQLLPDVSEDITIAALLDACVQVDRALVPQEGSEYGSLHLARNASHLLGVFSAQTHFLSIASQWISRLLTCHKTMLHANAWVQMTLSQQQLRAHGASASAGSSGGGTAAAAGGSGHVQFDVSIISAHVRRMETSLQQCIADFQSVWACYSTARKNNYTKIAHRFSDMIGRYEHVEADPHAGAVLANHKDDMFACSLTVMERAILEVDWVFEHFKL